MKTLASIILLATASFGGTFSVFDTGVNSGLTLATPGGLDPHYTSGRSVYVEASPNGSWIGSDSLSQWIGPDAVDGSGSYTLDYQVSFDLTGFNPATASLSGQWATDNSGNDILINGNSTGNTATGFGSWSGFTISSGFRAGINTLDFLWTNSGGPGGLRVEFNAGTADTQSTQGSSVPEPGTFVLLGIAIAGAGLRRRLARG